MDTFLYLLILAFFVYHHLRVKEVLKNHRNDLFDMEGRLIDRMNQLKSDLLSQSIKPAETEKKEEQKSVAVEKITEEVIAPVEEVIPPYIITEELEYEEEELQTVLEEPIKLFELPIEESESKESLPNIEQESIGWFEKFSRNNPDLERFIGENLISKIGIAILVLGIGFFVKYAIDQNWINEVARAGIGILSGAIVLGFAHKLRSAFKAFSSVLVAGGISIFYFTLTISFQEYHLFSQTVAFILLCIVTSFSVIVSLNYNKQELAILSLIGGFASPLMVSTGDGNYIVLFSYLLVLDTSLLLIAFYKNWSILNGITYALTVLMFGGWLQKEVLGVEIKDGKPYLGALGFATAFYFVFTFSNLINQIKEKQPFRTYELSLIVSNAFLYFTTGFLILETYAPSYKGLFSIGLAAFNFLITFYVVKTQKVDKNLFYLLVGLTLTFITLAIPIQFSGNYITLFWALEASLLLWLSQKSNIVIYRFVSIPILLLSLFSLVIDWKQIYGFKEGLAIVLNEAFIASIVVCGSVLFYLYLLRNDADEEYEFLQISWNKPVILNAIQILLLPLLYFTGILEWNYHFNKFFELISQVNGYNYFYHLVFTSIVIYFLKKKDFKHFENLLFISAAINILGFLSIFSGSFLNELFWMIEQKGNATAYNYIIHLIGYIPLLYQLTLAYSLAKPSWPKLVAWLLVIVTTLTLSKELEWQVLYFNLGDLLNNKYWFQEIERISIAVSKAGYPILWSIIAFVCLSFGIKKGYKSLRIASLSLIGLTILKLFFYDITNVSEGGKIAAFILLGIVLLIISFTYQKIKAMIIDGEEEQHEG
jgi:uncharacterized membrane protein